MITVYARTAFCCVIISMYAQKNAPNLASCSFDKHGRISTIFGKQHQHTFTTLSKMTEAGKVTTDIRIRIRIYLELLIQIPDYVRLR